MDINAAADVTLLRILLWREARGEVIQHPDELIAIGYTVIDRVKKPSWWGHDVLSVISKKWQYSSLTAPGDPNLVSWPTSDDVTWAKCGDIAYSVYTGAVPNPTQGADSYYAVTIAAPKWATPDKFVKQIGKTRFYNTNIDHEAPITGHK